MDGGFRSNEEFVWVDEGAEVCKVVELKKPAGIVWRQVLGCLRPLSDPHTKYEFF